MSGNKQLERALRDAETERDLYYSNSSNNNGNYQGPPVYSNKTVIIQQPTLSESNRNRCPLPISIISNDNPLNSYVIPYSGVQLLNDVEQISIEQTVELQDLSTVIESVSRFIIKGDHGQILYSGLESSPDWQRLICGSRRNFIFRVFDRSKQEAMFFTRRSACSSPFGCLSEKLNVFITPCEYIGCVKQLWSPMSSSFSIRNCNHSEVFLIEGPSSCFCSKFKEIEFQVLKTENIRSTSTITHQWDERLMNYNLTINFPPRTCYIYKALLMASAILLQYKYIDTSTSGRCCHCSS